MYLAATRTCHPKNESIYFCGNLLFFFLRLCEGWEFCRVCVCPDLSDHYVCVHTKQENTYLWRTSLYLAASASAEFFADIALAPMEAVKVRIQTKPGYANTLRECVPKMYAEEGVWA